MTLQHKLKPMLQKVPTLYRLLRNGNLLLKTGSRYIKVVTIEEATKMTLKWAESIPNKFDVIIGIPRSGLMIANILAIKFGRPLSTPNAFVQGEVWQSLHVEKPKVRNVLLVEDDVIYGKQIQKAYKQLKDFDPSLEVEKASLFVTSKAKKLLNYHYMIKNPPLIYEWTLLTNMAGLGALVVDMDGVLCKNPSSDDLKNLAEWYAKAKPHMIPRYTVEAIVTARIEKYRIQTEDWLAKHNVKYNRLYMMNCSPVSSNEVIKHKVDVIRRVNPFWFWESSLAEATQIWKKTKVPMLCVDKMVMLS